eukprot:scaffold34129_cov32-Tisochrysis_lutea.AAC.6
MCIARFPLFNVADSKPTPAPVLSASELSPSGARSCEVAEAASAALARSTGWTGKIEAFLPPLESRARTSERRLSAESKPGRSSIAAMAR